MGIMREQWINTTLGKLCDAGKAFLQTGPFGSQLHACDYVEVNGVPVVPTSAIGRRKIDSHELPLVSEQKAAELRRHRLQPGDILFARRGVQATGLSALVKTQHENWICGTGAILLMDKSKRNRLMYNQAYG
jgi:type I restriction enzyme S subunit